MTFNLPEAPLGLLNGITNALDPKGSNMVASGVSGCASLVATGLGINEACLALGVGIGAATGLGTPWQYRFGGGPLSLP